MAQSVVDVVVASPEAHQGGEVDSVPEDAVALDSLVVAVVASREVHREDVVGSAEDEVKGGWWYITEWGSRRFDHLSISGSLCTKVTAAIVGWHLSS